MQFDSCQAPGPAEDPTHWRQTSGWLHATSHGTKTATASLSPGRSYRRWAKSGADILHTEARLSKWATLSPRRRKDIETHRAIANASGRGDMPARKRTTPQTQPPCAGSLRQEPDTGSPLAYGHYDITREEWIPPFLRLRVYRVPDAETSRSVRCACGQDRQTAPRPKACLP
jgi:hypothetical protein